jgi:Cd2+/Zn2+-exporting ATPase
MSSYLLPGQTTLPRWKLLLGSAAGCGAGAMAGILLDRDPGTQQLALIAYCASYLFGGWDAAIDAVGRLRKLRLDIHFLMLAVAIGAAAIGAWWEGAALLFLFSLSNGLEALALARTEREIRSLFRDVPVTALRVQPDGTESEVEVAALLAGDRIRVLPDRLFPADGRVISGQSAADESSLTGESEAVDKEEGDTVFGGTLNTFGPLIVEILRPSSESAHARIIRLIRDAQASKAPSQRFTDRFGTGYTISLLGITLVMFLVWHFGFGLPAFRDSADERSAFYRAMTLLVVGSPCALVISIPSAILAGIAAGARRGILFRGGIALENLATINRLAVDKTGTLTEGKLVLIRVESEPAGNEKGVLHLAASLSRQSTHPLSRAIAGAYLRATGKDAVPAADSASLAGQGVTGTVDGRLAAQGRRSLFPDNTWLQALPDPEPGLTEVLVSNGVLHGRLLLRDGLRPESGPLIASLQRRGIRVTMLTGDRPQAAELVARELHLNDIRAGLHPEDKVAAIREWRAEGEIVAMVGDGTNDAPSLAAADISIGMGLRGSDAVLEQSDVILTRDRLERVLEAIDLSHRCRSIIRQNITISIGVVIVLALSALAAIMPLPIGVLGHEGSTVLVVLNSLRLLLRKHLLARSDLSPGGQGDERGMPPEASQPSRGTAG